MQVKVILMSKDLSAEEVYQVLQAIRDCEQEHFPPMLTSLATVGHPSSATSYPCQGQPTPRPRCSGTRVRAVWVPGPTTKNSWRLRGLSPCPCPAKTRPAMRYGPVSNKKEVSDVSTPSTPR